MEVINRVLAKIVINQDFCKGCKLCIPVCPHHLIEVVKHMNAAGYHPVEFHDVEGRCTGCTFCALICPDTAIEVYRGGKGYE